ncbi:hypothetical protein ABZW10_32890 [Kitasatospora sp. NPDC004723]|uniref:hypothetical protein n=1 Tax=Kitasatospora sp. NPDC004723 TaxID=3154288 RepID=UPI0033B557F3
MTPPQRRALGPGLPAPGAPHPHRPPAWLPRPAAVPATPADRALDALAPLRTVAVPAAAVESALHLARALLARRGEDPAVLAAAEGLTAALLPVLAAAGLPVAASAPPVAASAPPVVGPGPTTSTTGTVHPGW